MNGPGLVFLDDSMTGEVVELEDGSALVGRTPDCDVFVRNDQVSRRHAMMTILDGHTYIEDLQSSNGTAINGRPCMGRIELRDGDLVRFAVVTARYAASAGSGLAAESQQAPGPVIDSPANVVQYDVGSQEAATIHNVGRDQYQYLIEQRDSFARDIASTKTKARFAIWAGAVLAVVGFVVIGIGFYHFTNGLTSFNQNTTNGEFNSVGRSYFHFFIVGGAVYFVGMILIVVGIVLHVVAASRRKQLRTNPAWANLTPDGSGFR
jgi:uncharacterized membrane protein